ncbi:DUF4266 domain-containing protein [Undibacterium sp. Xuan67W]|uniref:DUF4266 domain-containing protein n=1 Tax=Undibacterium sp. Xuan67W TaxID=3413057 RepID=UPI003BF17C25
MKSILKKITYFTALSFVLLMNSACSMVKTVNPWEKGTLARAEMTFENDKLDAKYAEHIYSSREAASGGAGVGGGGCGCN